MIPVSQTRRRPFRRSLEGRWPGLARAVARAVATLWLVVYGGIGTVLPVMDAQAEHAPPAAAHWEDANDTSCPPRHDPSTCLVCQQVVLGGRLPADRATLSLLALAGSMAPAHGDAMRGTSVVVTLPSTRAPPIA